MLSVSRISRNYEESIEIAFSIKSLNSNSHDLFSSFPNLEAKIELFMLISMISLSKNQKNSEKNSQKIFTQIELTEQLIG